MSTIWVSHSQVLVLAGVDKRPWEDVPDADLDPLLHVEVEVPRALQTLVLGSVKVDELGPLDPREEDEVSLDGLVPVEDGRENHEEDEERQHAQKQDSLQGPGMKIALCQQTVSRYF